MLIINELGEFVDHDDGPRLKLGLTEGYRPEPEIVEEPKPRKRKPCPSGWVRGPRKCDVCGEEFLPRNRDQKRCSVECSRAAKLRWQRNRNAELRREAKGEIE